MSAHVRGEGAQGAGLHVPVHLYTCTVVLYTQGTGLHVPALLPRAPQAAPRAPEGAARVSVPVMII